MATLKSGWLRKEDGLVWKNWKKRFCVIQSDGKFSIYKSDRDKTSEEFINVKTNLKKIDIGFEIGATNLPNGRSDTDSMFAVITKNNSRIFLAESESSCREWVGAIKNAKDSLAVPNTQRTPLPRQSPNQTRPPPRPAPPSPRPVAPAQGFEPPPPYTPSPQPYGTQLPHGAMIHGAYPNTQVIPHPQLPSAPPLYNPQNNNDQYGKSQAPPLPSK